MIDPRTKPEGEEYMAYNRRRWGSDGWTHSMRRMGQQEGAAYGNWVWWPNTTNASRLLLFAEQTGQGDAAISVLYKMCYEEGENVSLRETVAKAAERAGVEGGAEYVLSGEGMPELQHALQNAKAGNKRVSAAPTFNIRVRDAAHSFSGAQDTQNWIDILDHCARIAMDA